MAYIHFSYTKYGLSKRATATSVTGGIFTTAGIAFTVYSLVYGIFGDLEDDFFGYIVCGLIFIGIGFAFQFWAKRINDKKAYKKWVKLIDENNLTQQVSSNIAVAVELYKKAPTERCKKYILQLNPLLNNHLEASKQTSQPQQQTNTPPSPTATVNEPSTPLNVQPAPQAGGFCRNCGSKFTPDSKFCNNCGASVVY